MSTNIKAKIAFGSNIYDKQYSKSQHFSVVVLLSKWYL